VYVTIVHASHACSTNLRALALSNAGFADITQDMLFSRIAGAHVVPRAVRYDQTLAAQVCKLLPAEAASPEHLQAAYKDMAYAPDVKNMALETAIVMTSLCSHGEALESSIVGYLQESADQNSLMAHLKRSLVFILGSSTNTTTLQWLVESVVLAKGWHARYGLRAVDKITLMKRIVRSPVGFKVSAEVFQKHAVNRTEDSWNDQDLLVQLSVLVTAAKAEMLPAWLPDSISSATFKVLRIQKDIEELASEILCA
jgi:hypothetical protein